MSDTGSPRRVEGLAPRRQLDISLLQRKNRERPAADEVAPGATEQQTSEEQEIQIPEEPRRPPKAQASTRPHSAMTTQPAQASSDETTRISFYVPEELSRRAKAAFRATSFQAGDRTWSAFLVRALESEVNRREIQFNEGERFEDSGGNLPAGRPLT